jgi:CRISPR/Cas system Type II protein with McrA/HNH and RuvC-like nuclease domain
MEEKKKYGPSSRASIEMERELQIIHSTKYSSKRRLETRKLKI